jgi:hypothetical protein
MKQATLTVVPAPHDFTPKAIATFYFKKVNEASIRDPLTKKMRKTATYVCHGCSTKTEIKINKSAGYQNLAQHVYTTHKDFYDRMSATKGAVVVSLARAISGRALNVFGCLDWMVHANLAFTFFSTARTKQYSSLRGMTPKTIRKYLHLVSDSIRLGITEDLPDSFGIIFDGWSCRNQHFIAVFATYMSDGKLKTPLLAMAPLHSTDAMTTEDESKIAHGAREHVLFIKTAIEKYSRSLQNVEYIVCDNCNVNKRMAKDLGVPMVGCASHRFNLAVQKFMNSGYKTVIDVVHKIMVKLKTLNNGVRLRTMTKLTPILFNATRWSSYYSMLKRFMLLKGFLADFPAAEFRGLLPSLQQEHELTELLEHLKTFESVTKALQREAISMADVRTLFDELVDEYPGMKHHLAVDAAIVHSPSFEKAVVKVQRGKRLATLETIALCNFERDVVPVPEVVVTDYATRVLKRARIEQCDKYEDIVRHLPPTSNLVERFFSQAKFVLSPLRQKMLPANFEAVLYLKLNPAYWSADVVADVVHQSHVNDETAEESATEDSDESEFEDEDY